MTAPKKPRAAKSAPAPAAPLTVDQQSLLKHYAEINDEAQQFMLRMMEATTKSCPRHVRPELRLVGGGGVR